MEIVISQPHEEGRHTQTISPITLYCKYYNLLKEVLVPPPLLSRPLYLNIFLQILNITITHAFINASHRADRPTILRLFAWHEQGKPPRIIGLTRLANSIYYILSTSQSNHSTIQTCQIKEVIYNYQSLITFLNCFLSS